MRTHEHKGRLWVEIGEEPYTRKDGKESAVIVWAVQCAAPGCDVMVQIRTARIGYEQSRSFDTKHCPAHKLTKEQIKDRWLTAIQASRSRRDAGGVEDLL